MAQLQLVWFCHCSDRWATPKHSHYRHAKNFGLGPVIPLLNASPAVLATSQEDRKLTWNPVRCLPSCLGTLYALSYPTLQQPWKVEAIGSNFWMRKQRLEELHSFLQSHRNNGLQIWTQISQLLKPYSFILFSTSFLGFHVPSCKTWLLNISLRASLAAQLVQNLPAMRETWVWPLIGKIPWRRKLQPTPVFWPGEFHELFMCSQRVRHDWMTFT